MASLTEITRYTDAFLRADHVGDWDNALNGLQIENSGRVTRIGAAVDVSTRVLTEAGKKNVDFLIVHHGLFWPGLQPVTRSLRRQLRIAFETDMALYSAHLPLDVHPKVGNNAQLVAALGLKSPQQNCRASVSDANRSGVSQSGAGGRRATQTGSPEGADRGSDQIKRPTKTGKIWMASAAAEAEPFLEEKGQPVGLKICVSISPNELIRKLQKALNGPVKVFDFGPKQIRTIGVVTGAGGSEIYRVAEENIDTFITGEAPHWAAVAAEELGMNLLLGGHYATEVFGVKALAAHLSKRFRIPWEFIDCPTGL